jgi:hypothetical protein
MTRQERENIQRAINTLQRWWSQAEMRGSYVKASAYWDALRLLEKAAGFHANGLS